MTKWIKLRFRALTVEEVQTIGFWFGLGAVTFWMLSAVIISDAPVPRPELVAIVAGLLLQRAFRKETANDEKDDRGVSKVVVRDEGTRDERDASRDFRNDRRADRVRRFHLPPLALKTKG
jgi:hypothetical protein